MRSIIALMWSVGTIAMFFVILTKDIKSEDKTTFMIINSVMGIMGFILGYYFGASKTQSENTGNAIEQLTKVPGDKDNQDSEKPIK